MESSTNRGLGFILCCSAVGVALFGQAAFADQFCSNNGGTSPLVCIEKDGPLVVDTHFRLDFNDPANVDITLLVGSQSWKLWSQVSQADPTPANIGAITIDPTIPADNFGLTIANGTKAGAANVGDLKINPPTNSTEDFDVRILNGTGAGAANLGSAVLTEAGHTGYSNLKNSIIGGDLNGSLTLVQNAAGNGGTVQGLDIGGDLQGSLKATTLNGFVNSRGFDGCGG